MGWKHGALIQRLESQRKAQLLDLDKHGLLAQDVGLSGNLKYLKHFET